MGKEYLYICDRCQNEIGSKGDTDIICNVCGNKIKIGRSGWSNQKPKRQFKKSNNLYYFIAIIIILGSIRYYLRQENKKTIEQGKEMARIMNLSNRSSDYQIDTYIKLTEKPTFLPIFKKLDKITNTSLKSGNDKGIIIKLISYKSIDSDYSNIKSSRDSLINNYFVTIGDSIVLINEKSKALTLRYNSLLTDGYLMKGKEKYDFHILSDYDSIQNKNWHLILFNLINKESIKEASKIIESRQFGEDKNT